MAIEKNRAASEISLENAFTNNTFSLSGMEKVIRDTMENSFNFLMRLQQSYTEIHRFNFTESDIYVNENGKNCISVPKDFIDGAMRKVYRHSRYYNKFIDLSTVEANPKIFLYTPMVLIDDQALFSHMVKPSLDGKTEIMFTHIRHLHEFTEKCHSISVIFFRNATLHTFNTNLHVVEKYGWKLPANLTNMPELGDTPVFFFMKGTEELLGSNYFVANIDTDKNFILDSTDDNVYRYFYEHPDVEITILAVNSMKEYAGDVVIHNRVDNNRQSALICLEKSEWVKYNMPVPTQNLLILKKDKITGALTYENNKEVILHYPNFYEIMSDDVDAEKYDYKIYYLYRELQEYLNYPDFMHYVYRYFAMKSGKSRIETIENLLYNTLPPEEAEMQEYFFEVFAHQEPDYVYNRTDFAGTVDPFDFDYKVGKFNEFVQMNPYILEDYSKDTNPPFVNYYLDVRTIDLEARKRYDTSQESTYASDYIKFDEPHYVFKFMNEDHNDLCLQFFIDGIYCYDVKKIRVRDIEYLYMPCGMIAAESRIDIERFERYQWSQSVIFPDTLTEVHMNFPEKEGIQPTLYDLFVVDENGDQVDRSLFKIYALVDLKEYNVSDVFDIDEDSLRLLIGDNDIIVGEDGHVYVTVEDELFFDGPDDEIGDLIFGDDDSIQHSYSDNRLPVKYMHLSKLKVFASDPSVLNRNLTFMISKVPYSFSYKMTKRGLPRLKLFSGKLIWTEDHSYIRTYVNGRLQEIDYDIVEETPMITYITPRCFLEAGDVFTVVISPYSYEQEFTLSTIPDNFRITMDAALSKPFDLVYYDAYLNGKRLNETNIEMVTPNIIQLYNVESTANFVIFRKDRDIEFAGYESVIKTPLDVFMAEEWVSEEDKQAIVKEVLIEKVPEEYVNVEGTNTEPNTAITLNQMPRNMYEKYRFFLDVLQTNPVMRPNTFMIDATATEVYYEAIWKTYSNGVDRVVIRPSTNANRSDFSLKLGSVHLDVDITQIKSDLEKINMLMEETENFEILASLPMPTILAAVKDLCKRINGLTFTFTEKDEERGVNENELRIIVTDSYGKIE